LISIDVIGLILFILFRGIWVYSLHMKIQCRLGLPSCRVV
jgi:hypothetical protein